MNFKSWKATSCIVVISVATAFLTVHSGNQKQQEKSLPELYKWAYGTTVQVVVSLSHGQSLGSGVWVNSQGYVATCWHVVKDAQDGKITVNVAASRPEGMYTVRPETWVTSVFFTYPATVIAHDSDADVAILKTEASPFTEAKPFELKTKNGSIKTVVTEAKLEQKFPDPGTSTMLAGFPLGRPDLLIQPGTVAGIGIVNEATPPNKHIRILVSLVSNPANSGGPVLDNTGDLVGLLEGNLASPIRDKNNVQVEAFRPMRDSNGAATFDKDGKPRVETVMLSQNSGISIVVPSSLILPVLNEAVGAAKGK